MKKNITLKFEFEGKKYSKKAALVKLSSGSYVINEKAKNDCIDIWEDEILDRGFWSVMIQCEDDLYAELRLKYNHRKYELTFDYVDLMLWNETDPLLAAIPQNVTMKVTNNR